MPRFRRPKYSIIAQPFLEKWYSGEGTACRSTPGNGKVEEARAGLTLTSNVCIKTSPPNCHTPPSGPTPWYFELHNLAVPCRPLPSSILYHTHCQIQIWFHECQVGSFRSVLQAKKKKKKKNRGEMLHDAK